MKVTYDFILPEDIDELSVFQISKEMYSSLFDLINLRRDIHKGYIEDVDVILDKLESIIDQSKINEIL